MQEEKQTSIQNLIQKSVIFVAVFSSVLQALKFIDVVSDSLFMQPELTEVKKPKRRNENRNFLCSCDSTSPLSRGDVLQSNNRLQVPLHPNYHTLTLRKTIYTHPHTGWTK